MLDTIDRKILKALQADGRMTITELAETVSLSKTPCTERVRRLEREGYITGYRAMIDAAHVGLDTLVFVQVSLERTTTNILDRFNSEVKRIPEVEAAHMIAGGFDYLLKVRTSDIVEYRRVLAERISTLPHVSSTSTYVAMETVKETGLG